MSHYKHMNRDDLDLKKFEEKLLAEKIRIESEFNELGRKLNSNGDWVVLPQPIDMETPEFDEIADSIEEFESDVAVMNVLDVQYKDVIDALKKITDGTYGICERTNQPIPEERLNINPSARTCV